jgi:primosomal protein N' (replication factor Y)
VAGRAGREERPGSVVLQTRHPDHPLLQTLIREGYSAFARAALAERGAAVLPPFSYQALWRAEAAQAEAPARFLGGIAGLAGQIPGAPVQVLGPAPAPLARRAGRYRWQLLLQSARRAELHRAVDRLLAAAPSLDEARRVRWSVDIDPVDLY